MGLSSSDAEVHGRSILLQAACVLLLACSATAPVEAQVIHEIRPNRGSIAGGTKVTIQGRGFVQNGPVGFEETGENYFTTVFFGNNVCEIDDYHTNQNQIVCYAPRMAQIQDEDNGNVIISVRTIGVGFASFATCSAWHNCQFLHRWGYTPFVAQHTLGGYSGTLLSLDGWLRSHDVADYSGEVGGLKCDFLRGRADNHGKAECMVMNAPVGRYNATIRVDNSWRGYGEPYYGRWASQVGLDGTPFHYTLHPHIQSISHNEGGFNGGAEIIIKGFGFSYEIEENEISLGGLRCKVTSVEPPEEEELEAPQTVICETSAVPSDYESKAESPGRGMSVRTYRTSVEDLQWYYENNPTVSRRALQTDQFTGGWTFRHDRAWNDRDQLVEGVFIPPLSRYYSWYIQGADYKALHISTNESRNNLSTTPVALSTWNAWSYFESESQISEALWLEAGKRYFVAALHSGDWHLDHFQVGLRIHDATQRKYHLEADQSVYELQEVDIQSNATFEQQEIVLRGVQTGTFLLTRSDRLACKNFKIDLEGQHQEIEKNASDFAERLTSTSSSKMCSGRDDELLNCDDVDASLRTIEDSNGFAGFSILFTFRCHTHSKFPLLSIGYENGDPNSLVTITNRSREVTDENRIRDPLPPVRGHFQLCFEEECTNDIDYNAHENHVEDALESLRSIDDVEVSLEDRNADVGHRYRIWFFRPYGNVTLLTGDSSLLSGDGVRIVTRTIQEGNSNDVFYPTVPMDWFEMPPEKSGSVRASVRGMLSSCDIFSQGGCSWEYKRSLTPYISSLSPGVAVVGDTLTITGSGFIAEISENDVFVGEGRCNVTSASSEALSCTLQDTNEGTHVVDVIVGNGRGRATPNKNATVEVNMDIFEIGPLEGSLAGGTIVNISGTGFSTKDNGRNNEVSVNLDGTNVQLSAEIVDASHRLLSVRMPNVLQHTSNQSSATIEVNGKEYSESFVFMEDLTWRIDSVEPTQLSVATSGIVQFKLANIERGADNNIVVKIGSRYCQKPKLNETARTLRCALIRGDPPPMPQEPISPLIHIDSLGYADADSNTINVGYRVDEISRDSGSIEGGQKLHIYGFGFGESSHNVEVRMNLHTEFHNWVPCEVSSVLNTEIVCTTTSVRDLVETSATNATLEVRRSRTPAVCGAGACKFLFSNESTPTCESIHPSNFEPEEELVIIGNLLFDNDTDVMIGNEICTVNAGSSSSDRLVCKLPYNRAGNHSLHVKTGYGDAFCPFEISHSLHVDAISSAAGSFHGGHMVSFEGRGFSSISSENIVHFDAKTVEVLESSFRKLKVFTPALDTDESEHVPTIQIHIVTGDGQDHHDDHDDNHRLRQLTAIRILDETNATISPSSTITASPSRSPSVTPSTTSTPSSTASMTQTPSSTASMTQTPSSTASMTQTPSSTTSVSGSGTVTPTASVTAMASPGAVGLEIESQTAVAITNSYVYKQSLTNEADSVYPRDVSRGSVLVISGSFPEFMDNETYISIGDVGCSIKSWNSSRVTCLVGDSPAGVFDVEFALGDRGRILVSSTVSVDLEVSTPENVTVGVGGGEIVSINGHGWPDLNGIETQERPKNGSTRKRACGNPVPHVLVCGHQCKLQSVVSGKIECVAPALITPSALTAFDHYVPQSLSGSPFASHGNPDPAFDGDLSSEFQVYSDSCYVGLDVGDGVVGRLTRVRFYPSYRQTEEMIDGVFEGSNDNLNWEEIAVVESNVVEGWNTINLNGLSAGYRYFRYFGPENGRCDVADIEFEGLLISTTSECDLTVKMNCDEDNSVSETLESQVSYSVSKTPFIESVSPSNGTSDGGTEVTISGSGFSSKSEGMDVHLNGVRCVVSVSSENTISCVTGKRDKVRRNSLEVYVAGSGMALHSETTVFRYLDRWSEPATWNFDAFPVSNDTVYIPRGQTVLLDQSTPVLWLMLIEGELIFDNQDLSLDANYILINGGRFEVGREKSPFLHKAIITLHGDRWKSVETPTVGAKVLSVFNVGANSGHGHGHGNKPAPDEIGYLDLHGRPRKRGWTFLETTASAGDDEIHTLEDVDFEPGDQLIVTSNGRNFRETEEVEVSSVCGPRCLKIKGEFQHSHGVEIFEAEKYGHSDVHMRAEVGLLSRNIVIKGDDNSRKQVFGVHTVIAHGGYYRIENVELTSCGQGGRLGRYCTHSHMAGDNSHSYVKSNSMHHAFQRATTIHGTHHFTTSYNVAYKVMGHTIFFEDGVEKFNPTEENLVVWTLPLTMGILSDSSPACFWMAGPTQFLRHNVAAGSVNYGFWYELPGRPHGPSGHHPVTPHDEDLGEFWNNTAHSCDKHGLRIYPIYTPRRLQTFYNLTSYRNGGMGIFGYRNGDLQHKHHKIIENGGLGQMWRFFPTGFREDTPNVKDCLYVGNVNEEGSPTGIQAIWGPMDDYFHVSGVTIVNYGNKGAISMCIDCDRFKQGGYTTRFEKMSFYNSNRHVKWTSPKKQIFWDLDGSLTGIINGTAMPYYKFNDGPVCSKDAVGTLDNGLVCDGSVRVRRLAIWENYPRELNDKTFIFKQLSNSTFADEIHYRRPSKDFNGWLAPMVTHSWYTASLDTLIDWQRFHFRYGQPEFIAMDSTVMQEWVGLEMTWIDFRWRNKVTYAPGSPEEREISSLEQPGQPDRMPEPLSDQIGTGWIDRAPFQENNTWHVVFNDINATSSGKDKHAFKVDRILCPPDDAKHPWLPDICLPPAAPEILTVYNWTDPEAWNGTFPKAGEDVTIDSDKHIIVNIETPIFKGVSVEGKLSFDEDGVLNAKTMTIWREMEMGTPDNPLRNATLRLHGDRWDDAVIVSNGLNLGNKVIAVFGNVTMAGVPKRTWTRLSSSFQAGSRVLEIQDEPEGWNVGDELVITATEYDIHEQETRKIESIDGKSITLDSAVEFTHSVASDIYGHTMAAAVGNLDRSVRVEGYISPQAQAIKEVGRANYGMHWVVSEVLFDDEELEKSHYVGHVQMENVEFFQCGKQEMEHGCFRFAYPHSKGLHRRNKIHHSSFSFSLNYGIVAEQHGGLMEISDNVLHRTFRSGIDFWDGTSDGAIITDNLIAGVFRSPDHTSRWYVPTSGIVMDGKPEKLSGNFIASSSDAGITFRSDACGGERHVMHNEVSSSLVGAFILSGTEDCHIVEGFKVWNIAHVGILTVDQKANLVLDGAIVADSHIGISLNFVTKGLDKYANITNSIILGSTSMSSCDASVKCHAVSRNDIRGEGCNSVFGPGYRRVGIVNPQYTGKAKTCHANPQFKCGSSPPHTPGKLCSLPWEKRYGVPETLDATVNIDNVTFEDFHTNDCGLKSVAVAHNPSQIDFAPKTRMSRIRWNNVDEAAKFSFGGSMCTGEKCTGFMYIIFQDVDGSMHGSAGGTLIYNNPPLSLPSPDCIAMTEWLGIWCPHVKYNPMLFTPTMRTNTALSPLLGSHYGDIDFHNPDENDRIYSVRGNFKDTCAKDKLKNWLRFAVITGSRHYIQLFNTQPAQMQFTFQSRDPKDRVLIKMFLQKPNTMEIYFNGKYVEPQRTIPSINETAGSNHFNPQVRHIWIVIRGDPSLARVSVVRTTSIQLNINLKVSKKEFWEGDGQRGLIHNLATLLSIPESRIRVVERAENILDDIRRRQLAVDVEDIPLSIFIDAEDKLRFDGSEGSDTTEGNLTTEADSPVSDGTMSFATNYADILEKQKNISTQVQKLVENGQLQSVIKETAKQMNGTLTSEVTVTLAPDPDDLYPAENKEDDGDSGEGSSGMATWMVATIAGVAVAGLFMIVLYMTVKARQKGKPATRRSSKRFDVKDCSSLRDLPEETRHYDNPFLVDLAENKAQAQRRGKRLNSGLSQINPHRVSVAPQRVRRHTGRSLVSRPPPGAYPFTAAYKQVCETIKGG